MFRKTLSASAEYPPPAMDSSFFGVVFFLRPKKLAMVDSFQYGRHITEGMAAMSMAKSILQFRRIYFRVRNHILPRTEFGAEVIFADGRVRR